MLTIKVPSSKSYTHRAYVMASLAEGTSKVLNPLLSADTLATMDACKLLGAKMEGDTVQGGHLHPVPELDCRNSGTSIRILMALCSLFDKPVKLFGDSSLNSRPMQDLADALSSMGAKVTTTDGKAPMTVQGPIKGGDVSISGGTSSQFISALLITLPLVKEESRIHIKGELVSRPYVDVTLEMLKESGITVKETDDGFSIPGSQRYKPHVFNLPGDWSSASYVIAAGCVSGSVAQNLREDAQGDRAILDIFMEMGADIEFSNGAVTTWPSLLHGIEVDCSMTPDLVPTIAVMGAMAQGETVIFGASHLRFKETDRIAVLAKELSKAGVKVTEKPDGLIIKGGPVKDCVLESHGDHRIAMALYLLNAKANVEIKGKECVDVSFPGYFKLMEDAFK